MPLEEKILRQLRMHVGTYLLVHQECKMECPQPFLWPPHSNWPCLGSAYICVKAVKDPRLTSILQVHSLSLNNHEHVSRPLHQISEIGPPNTQIQINLCWRNYTLKCKVHINNHRSTPCLGLGGFLPPSYLLSAINSHKANPHRGLALPSTGPPTSGQWNCLPGISSGACKLAQTPPFIHKYLFFKDP